MTTPHIGTLVNYNLVVHGWLEILFKKKSWTGLNAGDFLVQNYQWSLDFMDMWAAYEH